MKQKKIIIIGSGIGGLASAALLAKDGYHVTVLEKNEQAGGRAGMLEADGFRFDTGPSWYMMPDIFERYFAQFNKRAEDFYRLTKLTPQYRVFFDDHDSLDITGNIEVDKRTFETLEPGFSKAFDAYLAQSTLKYETAVKSILYKNYDSWRDFFNRDLLKNGSKMDVFTPMHSHIQKYFKHPRIQQILEYNLVFLGCSPKNAPALFSLMTHVDWNLGVWYPEGGIYSVIQAFFTLGKMFGVNYTFNEPVIQLNTQGGRITSVTTSNGEYFADAVISNADYCFTEDLLLDQSLRTYKQKWWAKKTLAPSAFLMYLGLNKKLPTLAHHSLYFGSNWELHFKDVFENNVWPQNPSVYINVPSRTDTTVAPQGYENIMVLVPVAAGLSETDEHKSKYGDYIVDYLESKLQVAFKENIVYKKLFSVSDFSSRYNSYKGNALGGLAHTLFQSAIWRPNNVSKKVPNLLFSGANTVPGIGLPPAIISSHLVQDRISNYFKQ